MKELPTLRLKLEHTIFGTLELTGIEWYSKDELIKMAQGKHPDSIRDYMTHLCSTIREADTYHSQLKLVISQFITLKKQALGEGISRLVRKSEERKVPKATRKKVPLALLMFEVDSADPQQLEETVEAIDDHVNSLKNWEKKLQERRGLLCKQLERVQNIMRDQRIRVELKPWQLEGPRKDSGVNLHE